MARGHALVVGGSLAGLFAANLLRSIGWEVAVFERSASDLAGRGAGLGTRAELFAVLRRVGIGLDDTIGVDVRSRLALDRQGSVFCEIPIRSVTTAWDRLYRALRAALPATCYHAAKYLQRVEMGPASVRAHFSDGSSAEADVLVGADGMLSTVRNQLMADAKPSYAGYVSWRGVVAQEELPAAFRETLLRHMTFSFPHAELAISVPMPAPEGGHSPSARRCQFSWFRPVDLGGLREICTDESGGHHGHSIAPTLLRKELVADLKERAEVSLAPQLAALVVRSRQMILQPIFDLESPRLVCGRVVLVGDAAFAARPHVGTGVTKAALDAQCLADALRATGDDVGAAFERYERERLPAGRELVARGRYLGAYLSSRGKVPRDAQTVMREFGSAGTIACA